MNWLSKNGVLLFSSSPNGLSRVTRQEGWPPEGIVVCKGETMPRSPMTLNLARPGEVWHLSVPVRPLSYMPGTKTGPKEISSGDTLASNMTVGIQAAMVASLVVKTWIEKYTCPQPHIVRYFLLGMHRRRLR